MRIKTLFSIPDGEKVTEKALRRVLISSICSILLCMTCLVSTTWAWFAVSIDNTENIIQIAQWHLDVSITPTADVQYEDGVYTLKEGVYDIGISFSSDAQGNDLDRAKVYLIMVEKVDQTETKYSTVFNLDQNGEYIPIEKTYQVEEGKEAELSFYFTRMNPQISNELRTAVFEEKKPTPETTDSTDSGEGTDSDTGTDGASEPSGEQSAAPSTETATKSTEAETA